MTVRQYLRTPGVVLAEVAREVGVHVSQVYRWRDGDSEPRGRQFARLVLVSGGAIKLEAVAGKPAPRRIPKTV